ncbi:Ig-like domain-containing protein [Methylococcus mesophilus]|uniref:Ig-like domain-containing protein n=1 Tax=Methylococcus mesophilus TaxID=2993564 RepID=UPI00224A78C0|nr:putative Ig domain-containing protein [Methylococcus mesophilus]UZR30904.1 putative Ig domain-containing protein [Methylococcus mesophilus]
MATIRAAAARRLHLSLLFILVAALAPATVLAAAKLKIAKATWSETTGMLVVKGSAKNASGSIEIYDLSGRLLGSSQGPAFVLKLDRGSLAAVPCGIRVQAGDSEAVKAVKGSPADCKKAPACQILTPTQEIHVSANTDVSFAGSASLNDPEAQPLKLEWDFAGGSMGEAMPNTHPTAYKRPDGQNTTVQFVRDNASYKVRFTAWDKKNRYCEDSVMVHVGNPPTNLPDVSAMVKQAQDSAPRPGSQLAGNKGDVVVLPFADLTMPGTGDYRYTPNIEQFLADGAFSNLNAVVYRKDRLPVVLDATQVVMKFAAASNPSDPVGPDSINSTSQNWPLNPAGSGQAAALLSAAIQKTDLWEVFVRPDTDVLAPSYKSRNWVSINPQYNDRIVGPDEGLVLGPVPADGSVTPETKGRYMPGRANPYTDNAFQEFTSYDPSERKHLARAIPLTDVDDAGRVNPVPLLRIEAVDKTSGAPLAAADAVLAAGRDVHCRECHAKGKIGANDQIDWSALQSAFHSGDNYGNRNCWFPEPYCSLSFAPPVFADAASDSLFDQEHAANRNIASLHSFYDNTGEVGMANGWFGVVWSGEEGFTEDHPNSCNWCHRSRIGAQMGQTFVNFPHYQGREAPTPSNSNLSEVMHNWHAQLQLDPADATKVLRNPSGRPKLWNPADGPNPNTLFPTVDANGNALPMEQNCLRCHAGHRDQLYRDRMYTAGVTCYDCHGDMSAVGAVHDKPKPGYDGNIKRLGWYEQPDCGSCHTGNANQGADGKNGFFSAGVMRRAFDDGGSGADRSATSRTPKTPRFAVHPGNPFDAEVVDYEISPEHQFAATDYWLNISLPLYRNSKDTHGNVPCAACHGGAHENWPNRDPKANDNVTAMQLQGHTGNILECNVCHTADSFRLEADLDGGQYSGDAKPGILGGPHNLHPISDPYWWKSTEGDSANADGTTYGGWHNNYAKQPGANGEDQCAACHGNDHKGARLSKTPVDRVFDFRGFNAKKLKKAGFKSKVIKVPAGTEIGCDTCHSIETSCIGSPAGSQCGVASSYVPVTVNHDPVITSTPGVTEAVMGEAYSYQVTATDPDGDPLTFSLATRPWGPDTMTIDQNGVLSYDWPMSNFASQNFGQPFFSYAVRVTDGKGGYATQTVGLVFRCPQGQSWVNPGWDGKCVPDSVGIAITSQPGIKGLNSGETFSYQVTATSDKGLPLSYALEGQPAGMSIDAKGLITWQATAAASGGVTFQVLVTDGQGGHAGQSVTVNVCVAPQTWHSDHGMCM